MENTTEYNIENDLINIVDSFYSLYPKSTIDEFSEHLKSTLVNIGIPEDFSGEDYLHIKLDKYLEPKYVLIDGDKIFQVNKEDITIGLSCNKNYYKVTHILFFDLIGGEYPQFDIFSSYHKILSRSNFENFEIEPNYTYQSLETKIPDNVASLKLKRNRIFI